ncbi:MAG TPA: response regulator [Acidobacteriaceae bacterium]|nr:response regulator [Acidobacteriaceae bacterium]
MSESLDYREASAVPPSRPTILLVEDDRAIRYLFSQVLHNNGYFVIAAEDGATGLDIARARIHTLDAVITDSRMPGLDGRELVTQIRSLRSDIPILVVSGAVETANRVNASDSATRYFAKPVSPERLVVELRRSLRNASR